jgi:hypothetical protein
VLPATMEKFVEKIKELGKKRGRDAKFFTTTKKGEIHELRNELMSKEKKIEAVKKIIAAMTVGKDVSSLFTDVINCMQTDNIELKKLVYVSPNQPRSAWLGLRSPSWAGDPHGRVILMGG